MGKISVGILSIICLLIQQTSMATNIMPSPEQQTTNTIQTFKESNNHIEKYLILTNRQTIDKNQIEIAIISNSTKFINKTKDIKYNRKSNKYIYNTPKQMYADLSPPQKTL